MFLDRELSRPHRERAKRCGCDAELADSGDQLQHEAADLALQVEVVVLVIETYRAGGDDQDRSDDRQRKRDQPQPEIVVKHQTYAEPAEQTGHHPAQDASGEYPARSIDSHRAIDKVTNGVFAKQRRGQPEQTVDHRRLQFPVDQAFKPEHREAFHRLDTGHGDGGNGKCEGAKRELVELGAGYDRADEKLGNEWRDQ